MSTTTSAATSSSPGVKDPHQIERDLAYLRQEKICEKLEFLVKQLLHHQPEDPVLFLCSQLRERCTSRSGSLRSSWNFKQKHDDGGDVGGAERPARALDFPPVGAADSEESAAIGNTAAVSPTLSDSANHRMNLTTPPGGLAYGAPHGAVHPSTGSVKSSRVTTPAAPRSAAGGSRPAGLERDESVKSDQSCFSIASTDMQEFLAEFRSARNEFLGPHCEMITRNDLAEIVDRVNLPLPDVRLIAELFDEMATASPAASSGAAAAARANDSAAPVQVPFEAFLARMNYKIQQRYSTDVIRAVFASMLAVNGEGSRTSPQANGGLGDTPRQTTPAAGLHRSHSASMGNGSTRLGAFSGSSSVMDTLLITGGVVPKTRVIEEGLWRGLGLRLGASEVNKILSSLGLPLDDGLLFHLSDFVALVNAASGQQARDDEL